VIALFDRLARPLLRTLDPETAHALALNALKLVPLPRAAPDDEKLRVEALGLTFPNPVGLAAGFDKNAEIPDQLLRLGFGFVEVGTVTPLPQAGNPKPRLFRLSEDEAIINRLGFNNDGHEAVRSRLFNRSRAGIVGVNIGANRASPDRVGDYVDGVRRFADIADFLTINVSSPNTPGLRDLQERGALAGLLVRVTAARDAAPRRVPLLLKIAPDLDRPALAAIAEEAMGAGIDGIIVSNTTVARDGLVNRSVAGELGGLSGRPLFSRSTVTLAHLRTLVGQSMILVGTGGVDSPEAAWEKIAAGANLVQVYAGMIFKGPGLPRDIASGLARRLTSAGVSSISKIVGSDTEKWIGSGQSLFELGDDYGEVVGR
jgi:dihydroorotate dehydrogenase